MDRTKNGQQPLHVSDVGTIRRGDRPRSGAGRMEPMGHAPKPIGAAEFERIVARAGWPAERLAEITGADLSTEISDPDQVRCLRALALDAELRDKVAEIRVFFPGLKLVSVDVVKRSIP
mgnify:CR=1 FL=1